MFNSHALSSETVQNWEWREFRTFQDIHLLTFQPFQNASRQPMRSWRCEIGAEPACKPGSHCTEDLCVMDCSTVVCHAYNHHQLRDSHAYASCIRYGLHQARCTRGIRSTAAILAGASFALPNAWRALSRQVRLKTSQPRRLSHTSKKQQTNLRNNKRIVTQTSLFYAERYVECMSAGKERAALLDNLATTP
jgi:hypothetical protein